MIDILKQVSLAITAAMLTATPVFGQTIAAKPSATAKPQAVSTAREASSGMATGREAQSGQASGTAQAQSVITAREAGSGMATGRQAAAATPRDASTGHASGRQDHYGQATGLTEQSVQRKDGSIVHADFPRSAAGEKGASGTNPLYQGSGASGTNPFNNNRNASSPNAAGYKDPEDMTTRYRPGNNKTTKTALGSDTSSGASAAAHAPAKEAGLPACDGASKDAAKCSAAPASGSQAATRVNKVESFTVKQ